MLGQYSTNNVLYGKGPPGEILAGQGAHSRKRSIRQSARPNGLEKACMASWLELDWSRICEVVGTWVLSWVSKTALADPSLEPIPQE